MADENTGWTIQSNKGFVDSENIPDGYVTEGALPDRQHLADQGVNLRAYFANLPVVD